MAEPRKVYFLVRVRRRGSPVRDLAVATPMQVQRVVGRLAGRPEVGGLYWLVHPAVAAPVRLAGRYRADVPGIGETRRAVHRFSLVPGVPVGVHEPITAGCGEPIRLDQLEIVPPGAGMPCYRCAARLPNAETRGGPADARRRHPSGHRDEP